MCQPAPFFFYKKIITLNLHLIDITTRSIYNIIYNFQWMIRIYCDYQWSINAVFYRFGCMATWLARIKRVALFGVLGLQLVFLCKPKSEIERNAVTTNNTRTHTQTAIQSEQLQFFDKRLRNRAMSPQVGLAATTYITSLHSGTQSRS